MKEGGLWSRGLPVQVSSSAALAFQSWSCLSMEQDHYGLPSAVRKWIIAKCLRLCSQAWWNAEWQITAGNHGSPMLLSCHYHAWFLNPDRARGGLGTDPVVQLIIGTSRHRAEGSLLESNSSSAQPRSAPPPPPTTPLWWRMGKWLVPAPVSKVSSHECYSGLVRALPLASQGRASGNTLAENWRMRSLLNRQMVCVCVCVSVCVSVCVWCSCWRRFIGKMNNRCKSREANQRK